MTMRYPTAKIAWRNLWRNKRRTLVTSSAIALGLAAMVFVTGWAKGVNRHIVNSATLSGLGIAQIHADGYRQTGDVERYMPDYAKVVARAEAASGVTGVSPRVVGEGLLAVGGRSSYLRLTGIIPERERKVTDWADKIVRGQFLGGPGTAVIGEGLAKNLEVDVGSKLVLTVADIKTGELKYRLVRVAGIISSENTAMDKRSAVVNLNELAQDMGIPGGAHEIALSLVGDPRDRSALVKMLAPIKAPGIEVSEWQVLVPVLVRMGEIQNFFMSVALGVIFFLISFGIVNTMSMSLLERLREFGIMRALGTSPMRLSSLILAEAAWLGSVGVGFGLVIGLSVLFYFSRHGILLAGMEAMDVSLKNPIYPIFNWIYISLVTTAFLVLTPCAALLVAYRASRIKPSEALRSE